jgi:hypothetical protein
MQAIDLAQYRRDEDVYYNDGYVWVTSRRVVHGGGEISLKRATGVRMRKVRAKDQMRATYILGLWTIGTLLLLLFSPLYASKGGTFLDFIPVIVQFFIVVALLLVVGGFIKFLVNRNRMPRETVYAVSIRYRFQSKTAIASMDQAYVERIVEAIQYVIRRLDGTAHAVSVPAAIGNPCKVPSPTIKGNTLYTGQATYDFAEIRSAEVSSMDESSARSTLCLGLLTLSVLADYAHQYLEAPWNTCLAFIRDAARFSIVFIVVLAPLNSWRNIYTVEITPRTGARAIVFASTSKADAKEVQQCLKAAQGAKGAPVGA